MGGKGGGGGGGSYAVSPDGAVAGRDKGKKAEAAPVLEPLVVPQVVKPPEPPVVVAPPPPPAPPPEPPGPIGPPISAGGAIEQPTSAGNVLGDSVLNPPKFWVGSMDQYRPGRSNRGRVTFTR